MRRFNIKQRDTQGGSSPFFMSKPSMKQVRRNGMLIWEVSHAGMTRYFKHDWQAKWHYESCIRIQRSRASKDAI